MTTVIHRVISQSTGAFRAAPCDAYWHSENRFVGGSFSGLVDTGSFGNTLAWAPLGSPGLLAMPADPSLLNQRSILLDGQGDGFSTPVDPVGVFDVGTTSDFRLGFRLRMTAETVASGVVFSGGFGTLGRQGIVVSGTNGALGPAGRIHYVVYAPEAVGGGPDPVPGTPFYDWLAPGGRPAELVGIGAVGYLISVMPSSTTSQKILVGETYSVLIERVGGYLLLYINGVLQSGAPAYFNEYVSFGVPAGGSQPSIGFSPTSSYNNNFIGHIDDFRFRNERL